MQEQNDNVKFAGRRENRAAAMQILYMHQANPTEDFAGALTTFFANLDHPRDYYAFAEELVSGALANLKEIDAAISRSAKNWTMDRIARVDLAILRLAVFELLYRDDIPPVVSINEAIDLSKSFAGADSRRFVNGVLDNIKGELKRPLRSAAK